MSWRVALVVLLATGTTDLLVAGCTTRPPPPAVACPGPVPVPANPPRRPTYAQVAALEVQVELAREKERDRGDCLLRVLRTFQGS